MYPPDAPPSDRPTAAASARAGRPDPVLALMLVATAGLGVGYGFDLGGRVAQVTVCWLAMAAMHVTLAVLAWRVARNGDPPPATRRLWRTLSFTGAVYAVGDAVQLVAIARNPLDLESALGVPFQSLCVVVGTVTLVLVMLASPLGITSRRARSRFWLDVATVMVAAATFGVYSTYLPAGDADPVAHAFGLMTSLLVSPGVFLVGVFAVVKLALSGEPPFTRLAGVVCATAAAVEGVVQVTALPLLDSGGPLAWVLGGNLVANGLLAAAARIQQVRVRADPALVRSGRRRPYSVLPYAAIGATYALLVVVLARGGLDGYAWIVVAGAITSTTLVVARQLAAFTDIARLLDERNRLAAQLTHQAFHDSLTGLANRALFMKRLAAALDPERDPGAEIAVLLVDLDDFKPVNDRFGHAAGDALLVQVGAWLRECVRDADTVARLGGDEFAVLLDGVSADNRATITERICASVQRTWRLGEGEVAVGASVGAAFGRPGERRPGELLHHADLAMYAAKQRGKGTFELFVGGTATAQEAAPPPRDARTEPVGAA